MSEPTTELAKDERTFLLKTVWEALQSAPWTKDSIIEFGKGIFSKLPLKSLDEKKFAVVFPNLLKVSDELGAKIKTEWQLKIMQEIMSTIAASEPPAPTSTVCVPDAAYKPPFITNPTVAKETPPAPQPIIKTTPPEPQTPIQTTPAGSAPATGTSACSTSSDTVRG